MQLCFSSFVHHCAYALGWFKNKRAAWTEKFYFPRAFEEMESEHYQKITILIQREFVSWRNWHKRLLHFSPLRKYCIESFFQSSVVLVIQFEERFAAWCLQVAKSVLSLRCDGWRRLSVKMAKKFHYCDLTLNWIETGRNFNQIHSLSNQKGRQEDENFLLPRKLFIRSSQQVFSPLAVFLF